MVSSRLPIDGPLFPLDAQLDALALRGFLGRCCVARVNLMFSRAKPTPVIVSGTQVQNTSNAYGEDRIILVTRIVFHRSRFGPRHRFARVARMPRVALGAPFDSDTSREEKVKAPLLHTRFPPNAHPSTSGNSNKHEPH